MSRVRGDDAVAEVTHMTLPPSGFLRIGDSDLEYRMIGPAPDAGADHRHAA